KGINPRDSSGLTEPQQAAGHEINILRLVRFSSLPGRINSHPRHKKAASGLRLEAAKNFPKTKTNGA
ncbi:MAG TPA: hypothetical protein PKU74_09365, partial [Candidatus Omnitrophota bacterium]|nr:hypothetical protein [Candidatus Omnitrophota bacterium]